MNKFESSILDIPVGLSKWEQIQHVRKIVRSLFANEMPNVKGILYRDNEDLKKTEFQITFFLIDETTYMFIEKLNQGSYSGAQLEKAINDVVSEILFTSFNETTNLYAALLNMIQEKRLIAIASFG